MRWDYWLLVTHVGSDVLIALAYFSIPIALIVYVQKRKDISFSSIFWLFSIFIFCCGLTHVASVVTLWYPDYWAEAWIKAGCAAVSVLTAIVLWPTIPKALKIPSPTQLSEVNRTLQSEINERKRTETDLAKANQDLLDTSRIIGMSEIATNVLHNVGNVLNSVNVSASLAVESVRKSKATNLLQAVELLKEHENDMAAFLTNDPKGQSLLPYFSEFSEKLVANQEITIKELNLLQENIEHIKDIVAMQQSYAKVADEKAVVNMTNLVEDSLRMNTGALNRHNIQIIREFEEVPPLSLHKHKVLQILINLVRNAKYACDASKNPDKRLTLRVKKHADRITVSVSDNGVGIPAENLKRIFEHGFTTRVSGHGFGLNGAAMAAKEMGGSLSAHSDGAEKGATFTLELPLASPDSTGH